MSKALSPICLLCIAALLLSACAVPVFRPAQEPSAASATAAQAARDRGDYVVAAEQYLAVARAADGEARIRFFTAAGDSAVRAGRLDLARQALDGLRQMGPGAEIRMRLLAARIDLAESRPRQALTRLPEPGPTMAAALAADVRLVRAQAAFRLGRTADGVRTMIARGQGLVDPAAVADNRARLWRLLQDAPLSDATAAGPVVRGWIELARIARAAWLDTDTVQTRLQTWRENFPGHPAEASILPDLLDRREALSRYPGQVALLLPLQGRLRTPATAIREGFAYAYYQSPAPRPEVRVYVVHREDNDVLAVYRKAVADGADVVVGPLSRAAVTRLAGSLETGVPVLALNYPDPQTAVPEAFYSIGLSPENEAAQVAARAASRGLTRALVLVPQGDWGARILYAFRNALERRGGTVADFAVYDPAENDYSQAITYLLQVDENGSGTAPAGGNTGPVPFSPKRRNDMDFIFVAAQPEQARLIRPQLRFFHASRVPVYAISSVYTGAPDAQLDMDMNGLRFCDMPWTIGNAPSLRQLRERATQLWPQLMTQQPRLFALGFDAYRLIPAVTSGTLSSGRTFPGVIGELYLADDGSAVRRSLVCAEFRNGVPELLRPAATTTQR